MTITQRWEEFLEDIFVNSEALKRLGEQKQSPLDNFVAEQVRVQNFGKVTGHTDRAVCGFPDFSQSF